jgi:hypothetical protein
VTGVARVLVVIYAMCIANFANSNVDRNVIHPVESRQRSNEGRYIGAPQGKSERGRTCTLLMSFTTMID